MQAWSYLRVPRFRLCLVSLRETVTWLVTLVLWLLRFGSGVGPRKNELLDKVESLFVCGRIVLDEQVAAKQIKWNSRSGHL